MQQEFIVLHDGSEKDYKNGTSSKSRCEETYKMAIYLRFRRKYLRFQCNYLIYLRKHLTS